MSKKLEKKQILDAADNRDWNTVRQWLVRYPDLIAAFAKHKMWLDQDPTLIAVLAKHKEYEYFDRRDLVKIEGTTHGYSNSA